MANLIRRRKAHRWGNKTLKRCSAVLGVSPTRYCIKTSPPELGDPRGL
ncbi:MULTISPECIES: hypothetical protein [unclassified Moorena]|nr:MULTISPECIES: hypothetical protein [unclassified Moorena]NEQ15470.1 hypothetical protein [Moorena sp. SIO3E2]NEP37012.1 hypothetical protein [Moorena sp. SIO3B2]NEQ09494.1 hypothetical protein [Moorena sp. SIO4E2]NES45797.1 hypothetical protein [Moorena sp. SIO2C4]NET63539.1 hypothetical protein [Moorena sp. SIO1G6]